MQYTFLSVPHVPQNLNLEQPNFMRSLSDTIPFFPPFIQASIGSLSEQSGHGLIKKHYMDIVGPLLPHTLRQLRALLDRAQLELVVHTVESSYTSAFTRALQDI